MRGQDNTVIAGHASSGGRTRRGLRLGLLAPIGLGLLVSALLAVVGVVLHAGIAQAATTASCTVGTNSIAIQVNGSSSSGNTLSVSANASGDYVVDLGSTAVPCGGGPVLVSSFPAFSVSSKNSGDVQDMVFDFTGAIGGSSCVAPTVSVGSGSSLEVESDGDVEVTGSSVFVPETSCTDASVSLSDISTLNVVGNGAPDTELDLFSVPSASPGSTQLDVHMGEDTPANQGTADFGSGGSSTTLDFSGEANVLGSDSVGTTFFPENTTSAVGFFGVFGEPNVLDLSGSTIATKFVAAMNSATLANPATNCATLSELDIVTSPTVTLQDCFSEISTINGSPSTPTFFEPDPTLTAGSVAPTFNGNDNASDGSVLDLRPFKSETGSTTSALTAAAGTDAPSPGTPGTVTATVTPTSGTGQTVTFANFTGVNQILGSNALGTTFQPDDSTTGIQFDGQGSGPNTLDLSEEKGTSAGSFTVDMEGDTTTSAGFALGFSTLGNFVDDSFSGVSSVLGATTGTDFEPGTAAGQTTFTGKGLATNNSVDVSGESSSAFSQFVIAMNAASINLTPLGGPSPASCGSGVGEIAGVGTSNAVDDCFTGVDTVYGGSGVATAFDPDPSLTSSSSVEFVGEDSGLGGSTVDLTNFGSSVTSLVASVGGDATGSTGQVTGTVGSSPVTFATFVATDAIVGSSSDAMRFQPGSQGGVIFAGNAAQNDVLDLTSESPTNFSSLLVYLPGAGSTCSSSQGELDFALTSGTSRISPDCFTNMSTIDGASAVPTTVSPAGSPPTPAPTFVGQDTAAGASLVSLADLPSSTTPYVVAANGNSASSAGAVQNGGTTYLSFRGVDQVTGSTSGTTFQPDQASGILFLGSSSSSVTSTLDLSNEASSLFTVSSGGNSLTSPGTVTGSPSSGAVSDSFAQITVVNGAASGTDFQPGNPTATAPAPSFVGACNVTNTLDMGPTTETSVSVDWSSYDTGCGGFPYEDDWSASTGGVSTSATNVSVVKGSTTVATTFQPGDSGYRTSPTFTGTAGLANVLDLSATQISETVNMNQDDAASQGTYTGGVGSVAAGSFQQVSVVDGSNYGTTFEPGTAGGNTFNGAPSAGGPNVLQLPSSASPLTVDVLGDSTGNPGDVTGLAASTEDFFSSIGQFVGNPGAGGSTFNASDIGASDVLSYTGAGQGTTTLSFGALQGTSALTINAISGQASYGSDGEIASFSKIDDFGGCKSGSSGCSASFQAGVGTNATFAGLGTANTLDFSLIGSTNGGVAIDESGDSGTAAPSNGGSVSFSDVQTFIGSGGSDTFTAGSGSATFEGNGGSDTMTLAADPAGMTFTLSAAGCSGNPVTITASCESASVQTSEGTDTAYGITTFIGSTDGSNTFVSDGYGGHTFEASGGGNVVDLHLLALPGIQVDAAGGCSPLPNCVSGLNPGLPLGPSGTSNEDFFVGVQTFLGSKGGTTFLSSGANGFVFDGESTSGTGDTLDLSSAPSGTRVNDSGGSGSVTAGSSTENFTSIESVVGPAGGGATFVAGTSAVPGAGTCNAGSTPTFVGQGPSNTLDLSAVKTSTTSAATVNAEPACPSGSTQQGTVSVVGTGELESFSDMTTFIGPKTGNTTFVTGSTGGLTFEGASQSSGNELSFSDVTPGAGVQVFLQPSAGGDETASPGSGTDLFTGISTVQGSGGNDTFNDGEGDYVLSDTGTGNVFSAASAPVGVNVSQAGGNASIVGGYSGSITTSGITGFVGSSAGGNVFTTDLYGGLSFSAPSGATGNSLSFQNPTVVPAPGSPPTTGVNLDITGQAGSGTASGLLALPSSSSTSDTFADIQSFTGSTNPDTFTVGLGSFTLAAGGAAGGTDILSLANTSVPTTVDLTQATPTVTGSGVNDTAAGFLSFVGSGGGTDFIAVHNGGYSFTALSGSNTLDLSQAPSGITVDAQTGTTSAPAGTVTGLPSGGSDNFTGSFQHFVGPAVPIEGEASTFQPGCSGGEQWSGVSGTTLDLDFSNCATSPALLVNAVNGTVTPLPGGGSDTFSGVTTFDGPSTGDTSFVAPGGVGSGGLTFNADGGSSDTLDTTAFPSGTTIDDSQSPGTATIDAFDADSFSGIACFVGSASGGTTFIAGISPSPSASKCSQHVNFFGKGTGNTLDLDDLTSPFDVSPTGGQVTGPSGTPLYDSFADVQSFTGTPPSGTEAGLNFSAFPAGLTIDTLAGTATVAGQPADTVSFAGFDAFTGSSKGQTTFRPDSSTSYTFTGEGTGNTLDLERAPAPLDLDLTVNCGGLQAVALEQGVNPCSAPLGVPVDFFTGISNFTGSSSGETTFKPDAVGSYSFTGLSSGNALDLSEAPAGISLNLTTTCDGQTVVALASGVNACAPPSGTPVDTFAGISSFTGSSAGSTTFTAPGSGGGDCFIGQGSGANTLAFGPLSSGSALTVDDTQAGTGSPACQPGVATGVASSSGWAAQDNFTGVSTFSGPSSGRTAFVVPAAGGVDVTGGGPGNTLDASAFPAGSSIDENPSSGPDTATPGTSGTPVDFTGIACVVGSGVGETTFTAAPGIGPAASSCSETGQPAVDFAGQGPDNALDLSGLTASTVVSPSAGTVLGTTAAPVTYDTFDQVESFTGSSSQQTTLDLSAEPAATTIDATTGTITTPPQTGFPVSFTHFEGFIGSSQGATTFLASGTSGGDVFTGGGTIGNTLSFAAVPPGGPGVSVNLFTGVATEPNWHGSSDAFSGMQTVIGTANNDTFAGGATNVVIDGNGGSDTLTFAGAPAAANVTLGTNGGSGTATGGYGGSLTLNGIQNVTASPEGGTLVGNTSPSVFTGGSGPDDFVLVGGNDTVNGGGGTNTLDLSQAPGFVSLQLALGNAQATGGDGVLTITPGTIQNVIGSNFGNHLVAGAGTVTLTGGDGNDWLQAGSGTDTLDAGSGKDYLVGGAGFDTMTGGSGEDFFVPGTGNGQITDPNGTGTLDYAYSALSVRVNLSSSRYTTPSRLNLAPETAMEVGGGTYHLKGVENILGSNHGDVLVGDSNPNTIQGGSGTNLIVGNGGNDTLRGGSGTNTFITGDGDSIVIGSTASTAKNTIDYQQAPGGATVNLPRHTADPNGYGGSDQLLNIENIIGSPFVDSLTLGPKPGTITEGDGAGDVLTGSKAGHDTMDGGAGGDTFVSVGPSDHMTGGPGPNQFYANNGFLDYITGGGVYDTAVVDCLDVTHKTIHKVNRIIEPPGGCKTASKTPVVAGGASRTNPPGGVAKVGTTTTTTIAANHRSGGTTTTTTVATTKRAGGTTTTSTTAVTTTTRPVPTTTRPTGRSGGATTTTTTTTAVERRGRPPRPREVAR